MYIMYKEWNLRQDAKSTLQGDAMPLCFDDHRLDYKMYQF